MNDTNKNIDLSIIPDQEINTKEIKIRSKFEKYTLLVVLLQERDA